LAASESYSRIVVSAWRVDLRQRPKRAWSKLNDKCQLWVLSKAGTTVVVIHVDSAMSTVSPLYPQEPTSSVRPATSEKCQNRK